MTSRRELNEFIELPFRLHSTSRQWVAPLRLERHAFLSRRLNPFFVEGDARLFLARREGHVVGRISAQVDPPFNRTQGNDWGMFGFLELEDDPEILPALLATVEDWLRARGRDRMVGPMDFRVNDESGILVEGFEREPLIRQAWHPPHYARLCEEAGLAQVKDLLFWELAIADRETMRPVILDLARHARERHGITIRHMTRRTLRADLDRLAEVYHAGWHDHWGFVPYTKADLDAAAIDLRVVFDARWAMVAERRGQTVGMALTVPDFNQVLRRMDGHLRPSILWHYLRRDAIVDRVRVGFLGVKPEYQHLGVAAALYVEHFDVAVHAPPKWGELGWVLEDNHRMNGTLQALGARRVKRYRVYERRFG